jgi:hypothetical protein
LRASRPPWPTESDRLAVHGRQVYWLPRGNISDSRMKVTALAKITGPKTLRTKGAVDRFAAKLPPDRS